jgi:hypothetical protein
MIELSVLFAVVCGAGYAILLFRRRRKWALLPLVVLGVMAAASIALTHDIEEAESPPSELRLYFSVASSAVVERVQTCLDVAAHATDRDACPAVLREGGGRIIAVFSHRAVTDMAAIMERRRLIGTVRSVSGAETQNEHGLTVEAALDEIRSEQPSEKTKYVILTPRTASVAAARASIDGLLRDRPDLRDGRIVFVHETALFGRGVRGSRMRHRIVPEITLEAPPVISADGGEYTVTISGKNETSGMVELQGLQLESSDGRFQVRSLRLSSDAIEVAPTGGEGTNRRMLPGVPGRLSSFTIAGSFETAARNSVTTHSLVVRNTYGETLLHLSTITRVEKPTLGVLRAGGDGANDFLRFARASGIDVEEVLVDFTALAHPTEREARLTSVAANLAGWGTLVAAEPLTLQQGSDLIELLKRTGSATPPSLLFIGAGSGTLFRDLTDASIAGWRKFLDPLGIRDLSGARKVLIAVDQSGSLQSYSNGVREAVRILYDAEYGLGARDANLLVAFCGRSEDVCTRATLESEVPPQDAPNRPSWAFRQDNWEGSTHLVRLRDYARQRGRSIFGSDQRTDVTHLVLFWDGQDIGGSRGDRGDAGLSSHAQAAYRDLRGLGVTPLIATFRTRMLPGELTAPHEVLPLFSNATSPELFRREFVGRIISQGLEVRVGSVDRLPALAQRRIRALGGGDTTSGHFRVVNSLFGPNTRGDVERAGAMVPLLVEHPSRFFAPLFVLKESAQLQTADPERFLNLRIGYLGLDVASEFAAMGVDTDRRRQAMVSGIVYSAVDAMGGQLRGPAVQWHREGDLVVATRTNWLPFNVERAVNVTIRPLERDGTPRSISRERPSLHWNELGLDRMGVDLSAANLESGELYELNLGFCHLATQSARVGECTNAQLIAPTVGAYPVLTSPDAFAKDRDPSSPGGPATGKSQHDRGGNAIPQGLAKLSYMILTITVAIGVLLL